MTPLMLALLATFALAFSVLCSIGAAVAWVLNVSHVVEVLDNGPES